MASMERSIEVNVPISTAYNQWTQFEEFPKFMEGVREVNQLDDKRLHWRAEIAGQDKAWNAEIVEQVPDRTVAWRSTTGATNAGTVTFQSTGEETTRITLRMEYEPAGVVENVGDALGFVSRRVEGDLERFKEFIESRHMETGAWRGEIHGSEVKDTSGTGQTGYPGESGRAAAAGGWGTAGGPGTSGSMGRAEYKETPSGLEATTDYTETPGRGSLATTSGPSTTSDRETGRASMTSGPGTGAPKDRPGARPNQDDPCSEDDEGIV